MFAGRFEFRLQAAKASTKCRVNAELKTFVHHLSVIRSRFENLERIVGMKNYSLNFRQNKCLKAKPILDKKGWDVD
jgi:hypothetical protein